MVDYAGKFKTFVELRGYELLGVYVNNKNKVVLKCPDGHVYSVTPNNFRKGSGCPDCYNGIRNKQRSHSSMECFKSMLEQEGYTLLSEYMNTNTKVELKCPEGHVYKGTPSSFKTNNRRCPFCAVKRRSEIAVNKSRMFFGELVADKGYELLSEYINNKTKIKLKCSKGHVFLIRPNDFNNGIGCPRCSNHCPIQAKEQFMKLLKLEGYELLLECRRMNDMVTLKCPNNHEWITTPQRFKFYTRCPHCEGSTGQRKLQDMLLDEINSSVIYNDRKTLNGLELDIYYPELKMAIEYQGNYWHNKPKQIERDERKKLLCKEKGIKLIEVWDDDFMKSNITELNRVVDVMGSL